MVRRVSCGQGKCSHHLTMFVVEAPAMIFIATHRKSPIAETEDPQFYASADKHPQTVTNVAVLL